jgi:formate dehydrogenase major subunit
MPSDRHLVEAHLDADRNDDAIAELCADAPPSRPWELALLARAYFQRGDSRGDLYSGDFFARRALQAGFDEPWLAELRSRYRVASEPAEKRACGYRMGGIDETRPKGPAPFRFNALSVSRGTGTAPKDFHWIACNVPCQEACPAQTDIPAYLTAIYDNRPDLAYRLNLESNVFPAILGRVCARPCEEQCRHAWEGLGESVAICFSKRAAADLKDQQPVALDRWFDDSGKQVAVVGSGVAGLTAARELARWGHRVTVFEKHSTPGGMLNQGIPEFRLPRDIIDREIEQIRMLGVTIRCNTKVGVEPKLGQLLNDYDAVIMAAGTVRPNILNLPGKHLQGVRHGLDFLLEANETGTAQVGKQIVVIGGGFTAMDCARTAKRLAAKQDPDSTAQTGNADGSLLNAHTQRVKVWYRRTENEMLITPGELEELQHEAIDMEFLVSPIRFIGENGRVTAVEFLRNHLGEPDAGGRRRPLPISGSEFRVQADTVILATGQFPDTDWIDDTIKPELAHHDGWLKSGADHTTAIPNLFVAGDFAQGATSLISAIGHAKQTARIVDEFLMGCTRITDSVKVEDAAHTGRIREMDAVPRQEMPSLPVADRDLKAEVETGYDSALAVDETQRCYRCHFKYEIDPDKCIYCDWCIKAKPRPECILKVRQLHYDDEERIVGWDEAADSDETYLIWINQDDCIRCGACVDACPVDAISLQKATMQTSPKTHTATSS